MENQFHDCYGSLQDGILTIGNSQIERKWDMRGQLPVVLSLKNQKTGKEWFTTQNNSQTIRWEDGKTTYYAFYHGELLKGFMQVLSLDIETDNDLGIGAEHLVCTVQLRIGGRKVEWIHWIYPELPIHRSAIRIHRTTEKDPGKANDAIHSQWPEEHLDCFPLKPAHLEWENVCFYEKTDDNEDLIDVHHGLLTYREDKSLIGNLFAVRDSMEEDGLLMIKEGPTATGLLPGMDSDFKVMGRVVFPSCWGFGEDVLDQDENRFADSLTTYGSVVMLWEGVDYRKALFQYHRAIHRFDITKDALIMSNTWGDGNADGRLGEDFLLKELKSAADLGVTFFQIDDGWEKGTTCNSVNAEKANLTPGVGLGEGYYKSDPQFWAVNEERFPNGLEPVVKYAKDHGIELGLWFSPDSANDFENWKRDSDRVIELYHQYQIKAFKMDGLRYKNKRCEENFVRFMQRIIENTSTEVFFNLDTTAGIRNGLFGKVQYGSIFLENRFTGPFGHWPNYWPHETLRHLWQLSRYIPGDRIQIEFLNPAKNAVYYSEDPISPAQCGIEYIFAISLFASPLAWMEMSDLTTEDHKKLKHMIQTYRPIQKEILENMISPIGEEPNGFRWSGLMSEGEKSGYLLFFREMNSETSHIYEFKQWKGQNLKLTVILGQDTMKELNVDENGLASVFMDNPISFALYRYEVAEKD